MNIRYPREENGGQMGAQLAQVGTGRNVNDTRHAPRRMRLVLLDDVCRLASQQFIFFFLIFLFFLRERLFLMIEKKISQLD